MPLTSAVAYLVAFGAGLPALLVAVYASADTSIAPYLTQGWIGAPAGSVMLMGHAPFYMGYWILRFLHLFGGYRVSWELVPWVLSAVASLLVGWAAGRAAGRAVGLLVSASLICAGSSLLDLQFSWSVHGLAYTNVLLLGAFAVWLTYDPARTHPIRVGLIVIGLTAVTATGIATDKIVLVAGLVPFAITSALVAWGAKRDMTARTTACVIALVGGSVVGSVLTQTAMSGERIKATPFPVSLASLSAVPFHLKLLTQSVFSLLNGDIRQADTVPAGPLGYLCAVAVIYLLVVAAIEVVGCLRRLASLSSYRRETPGRSGVDARSAQTTYWGLSAGVLMVAYLVTTIGVDIFTQRYLVTVAYAVLILGISRGATLTRGWRILTAGAVTTLIVTGALGLLRQDLLRREPTAPTVALADAVKHLAHREGATVVYAGYWDAYPLGWLVPNAVPVYPVLGCGRTLCPWTANQETGSGINTWYVSRRSVRSLLVLDRELDASVGLPSRPPPSLGSPTARFSLDQGRLHVYLYDYDLAGRFAG